MRALALEHLHSNPVGVYGDVLEERGIDVVRVRLDRLEPLPDWREYDLLVVMGGGMSVYEEDVYPWLADEKRAIREAVTAGLPYFGVCLGSQLLASSLGARVYKGPEPELGVSPVFLCEPAQRDPVFRGFPLDLEVFEWHADTFDLAEGAVALRAPPLREPGFRVGSLAYAIQCHLETTLDEVRDWFAAWPSLVEVFERRYGSGSLDSSWVSTRPRSPSPPYRTSAVRTLARERPRRPTAGHRWTPARTTSSAELLGRDDERAQSRGSSTRPAMADRRPSREGDTGIGKTALLDDSVTGATGMRVIRLAGVDRELEMPCRGLEDLCRPLLGHLGDVPKEHADALAAMLGLREGTYRGDRFAAYAGVLGLLAAAAAEQPLVVCVDDAHLLDDETSLEALGFVAGRIEAEGVSLLSPPRVARYPASPLSRRSSSVRWIAAPLRAATAALRRRALTHVAAEVIAVAGGNPLALVEIPLSLTADQRAGIEPIGEALQTRRSAEQALLERIASLTDRERRTLLVPALARSGDLAVVQRALKILDLDSAELDTAKRAGFVSLENGRIRFTHGLVRSTVAYGALRMERRQTHAALAQASIRTPSRRRLPGTVRWPPRRLTSPSQPRSRKRPLQR